MKKLRTPINKSDHMYVTMTPTFPTHSLSQVREYAGHLAPVILTLSDASGRSPTVVCGALAILLLAIHVSLPIFIAPHYSCLLTLLVPAQCTIRMLRAELHPPKRSLSKEPELKPPGEDEEDEDGTKLEEYKKEKADWTKREAKRKTEEDRIKEAEATKAAAPQWLLFWLLYTSASLGRGYVGIIRPGWKGWFELWRTVILTLAGGPWYSPTALL